MKHIKKKQKQVGNKYIIDTKIPDNKSQYLVKMSAMDTSDS